MNTHLLAYHRLTEALALQGFDGADASRMIEKAVRTCRKANSGHEEIVAEMLGLELEYILPLLRPKQKLFVNAAGQYEAYATKED